jgi:hypothetical protein
MIVGPLLALTDDIQPVGKALNVVIGEVLAYFVFLLPALRSLRRW